MIQTCESCGHDADVVIGDGSTWCSMCHELALAQGYDEDEGTDL